MMLLDVPEQLRCLWRHLRLLIEHNFIQGKCMNEQISLLRLWMDVHMSQQSNLKSLMRKTDNDSTNLQHNWLELVLLGDIIRSAQQVKSVGNAFVF